MKTAVLIERCIPDSLRLADHPDAAIVNQAIATVLTAWNESDSLTDASRAKDVHKALEAYFANVYQPHISKEDEDWNALKKRAESAVPFATISDIQQKKHGRTMFRYSISDGRTGRGEVFRHQPEGEWMYETTIYDNGADYGYASAQLTETYSSDVTASVKSAFEKLGAVLLESPITPETFT